MTDADLPIFAELMIRLETVYDKKPSQLRTTAYRDALGDVPIGLLREAVSKHIQGSRLFPRPHDLRTLADEATPAPQKLLPPAEHDGERLFHCGHCLDMGWIYVSGQPIHVMEMDVLHAGTGRPPVRPCPCARTNPAFVRRTRYARRDDPYRYPR